MNKRILIFNIVSFFAFWIIAIRFHLGLTVGFDTAVYSQISPIISDSLTKAMIFITNLGSTKAVVIVCIILLVIPKTRTNFGFPVAITMIISAITNSLLKHLFSRERPSILRLVEESGFSFPSGHSMNNMALYTIIILMLLKKVKNKALVLLIYIFPLTIGFSRIYLGVHYPSDVLAGLFAGFFIGSFVYLIFERFAQKNAYNI